MSGLARLRAEVSAGGAISLADLARRCRLRLPRHRRFASVYAAEIAVASIAGEPRGDRVIIEGRAQIEGEPARVWIEAARRDGRIELTAVFHGLEVPAREALKRLAAPSYDDEIDRLDLSEPRLVVSTAETTFIAGRAEIAVDRGVTFVATLRLPPAIDRLIEPAGGDLRFTLSGAVPEKKGADLRFTTSPPATLRAGVFALDRARVEIVTRTSPPRAGAVRETRVRLCGVAAALPRAPLSAPIPRGDELLQLAMESPRGVAIPAIEAVDPLLDGAPRWREAIADLAGEEGLRLVSLARDVSLACGKTASARCSIRGKDRALAIDREVELRFPSLTIRCVIGLPDDPAASNLFVEAEGDALLVAHGRRVIARPLDTTVSFSPERAIHALIERITPAEARRIADALDLRPVPDAGEKPRPPWTGTLAIAPGSARLTAFDDAERSVAWER